MEKSKKVYEVDKYEINKDKYEINKHNRDKDDDIDDEHNTDEDDEDEEFAKFKTIVAKQAVHVLRLSDKGIKDFVSKVEKGQRIIDEDIDKAQTDTVAAFYMSNLLSDDSKNKKHK